VPECELAHTLTEVWIPATKNPACCAVPVLTDTNPRRQFYWRLLLSNNRQALKTRGLRPRFFAISTDGTRDGDRTLGALREFA
jgi:hypothetical protein